MNMKNFEDMNFDVEHALHIFASAFCLAPVKELYNEEGLQKYKSIIDNSHIYFICKTPIINIEEDRNNNLFSLIAGNGNIVSVPLDLLETEESQRKLNKFLADHRRLNVLYIGQAYGTSGERSALTRLKSHSTLQEIHIIEAEEGYSIEVLFLNIEKQAKILTLFNPFAKEHDDIAKQRINNGIDKLYETSEIELISLYEAGYIRYFSPKYNKIFKESFPSTNLKILQDCYEKDFGGLALELYFDELPILYSEYLLSKKPNIFNIVQYNLNNSEDRKMFFYDEK